MIESTHIPKNRCGKFRSGKMPADPIARILWGLARRQEFEECLREGMAYREIVARMGWRPKRQRSGRDWWEWMRKKQAGEAARKEQERQERKAAAKSRGRLNAQMKRKEKSRKYRKGLAERAGRMVMMRKRGMSLMSIAIKEGIAYSSAHRILKEAGVTRANARGVSERG